MAFITVLGIWVATVVAKLLSSAAEAEMKAWSPAVIRWLVKFAVGHLPEGQRLRFAEEWQAHLNEVPGQIAKFVVALNFSLAAYRVALRDRQARFVNEWSGVLGDFEEVYRLTTAVVRVFQNDDRLACTYELHEPIDALTSRLGKLQEFRDDLAATVAIASVIPASSFSLVSRVLMRRFAHLRQRAAISQEMLRVRELSSRILTQVAELQQNRPPSGRVV
jgi:hypothetical protein